MDCVCRLLLSPVLLIGLSARQRTDAEANRVPAANYDPNRSSNVGLRGGVYETLSLVFWILCQYRMLARCPSVAWLM